MAESHDLIEDRLRAFGAVPVPPELEARHLAAIAAVAPQPVRPVSPPWYRLHPLRAAAAAVLVAFLGSSGLASAGALPGPVQRVAHDVLGAVGIEVPAGEEANEDGAGTGATTPVPGEVPDSQEGTRSETTHVSTTTGGDPVAPGPTPPGASPTTLPAAPPGASDAGAPDARGPGADRTPTTTTTTPAERGGDEGPGGPCNGPPPWVTEPDMTKAEKDLAQADRQARCSSRPAG